MAIESDDATPALITNDIVVFGLIAATLGAIFWLARGPTPFWKKVFAWVPALLLCYFVPAIYNTTGLIDGENSALYNPIASRILLPAALVLLTLSIDLKGILRLGPKLLFVFCMGTLGVVLGAIMSFQLMEWFWPAAVAGDTWKGMAALSGSWIGGGANMVAIREIYEVDATLFGQFAVVDVAVASMWMATLLFLANRAAQIDLRTGADTRAIDEMKERIAAYEAANARIPTLTDRHWLVVDFMRQAFLAKGDAPTIRTLGKESGVNVKELYQLFPKGPAKLAAKIAGIPKPHGCI